jgi:hypothetical protein
MVLFSLSSDTPIRTRDRQTAREWGGGRGQTFEVEETEIHPYMHVCEVKKEHTRPYTHICEVAEEHISSSHHLGTRCTALYMIPGPNLYTYTSPGPSLYTYTSPGASLYTYTNPGPSLYTYTEATHIAAPRIQAASRHHRFVDTQHHHLLASSQHHHLLASSQHHHLLASSQHHHLLAFSQSACMKLMLFGMYTHIRLLPIRHSPIALSIPCLTSLSFALSQHFKLTNQFPPRGALPPLAPSPALPTLPVPSNHLLRGSESACSNAKESEHAHARGVWGCKRARDRGLKIERPRRA